MRAEARVPAPVNVKREDVPVMFIRATEDTPAAIRPAWAQFEVAVGLRGRKFFGTFDSQAREYRVWAQLKEDDDPRALGFEVATLAGGAYLRVRLEGEPPADDMIPSTVPAHVEQSAVDASRPTIEFYRRRDVIELLLPITSVPKAHVRAPWPSRRRAADGLSPRLGPATRSTRAFPNGWESEGASGDCRCVRRAPARFEQ